MPSFVVVVVVVVLVLVVVERTFSHSFLEDHVNGVCGHVCDLLARVD